MTNTRTHHSSNHGHSSHEHAAPPAAKTTANKVIVVFKDKTPEEEITKAMEDVKAKGGVIGHRYDSAILGFSATMPDVGVQTLNKNPHLDYIEADGEVTIQTQTLLGNN